MLRNLYGYGQAMVNFFERAESMQDRLFACSVLRVCQKG